MNNDTIRRVSKRILNMVPNPINKVDLLPPSIFNLIEGLNNKQTAIHIRDNYAATIETIVKVCNEELIKFQTERTKTNITARSTKKKR